MKADKVVELNLRPNINGRDENTRKRKLIDVSVFPEEIGAYVIRFKTHRFNRFKGESKILKIGCTEAGFRNRFKNYNHQADMTVKGSDLYLALKERSQKTNVRLMHFLSHNGHSDQIMVELYFTKSSDEAKEVEYTLIKKHLISHGELPPLNFGMK